MSGLQRDFSTLAGANPPFPERTGAGPPFPGLEPVAVDARFRAPAAAVDPDPSRGWVRRVLPLVAVHRRALLVAVGCALVALAAQIAAPRVVMAAIDRGLDPDGVGLTPFVWVLAGLAVTRGAFTWVQRTMLFRFAYDLEADLRVLLFDHLGRMSFSFFDTAESGELISRANSDVRAVQLFLSFVPLISLHLAGLVLAFGLMLSVHVPLTVVAALPLLGVLVAGARLRGMLYPRSWLVQARQAEVAGVVAENVAGVRVVRSFAAEQQQVTALAHAARRLRWATVRQLDARARYGPALENFPRVAVALVLGYGGWLVTRQQVTIGAVVAFAAYVGLLQPPFRMLGSTVMVAQRAAASAARIYALLDEPPAVREQADARPVEASRGAVALRGVRFGYDPARPVLDGLDLEIAPGETVALVGRTGCGKSTVARLLARYYDTDAGAVLLDGVDVRALSLAGVRAAVTVVFDEPFLFAGSIHDNVAYARPGASPDEVRCAARDAQAADFIEALPDGYDTLVGERGYTLSGGQRQRIALARALLAAPAVLILDDATSAVDTQVEQAIHQGLARRRTDATTLLITQRESTIAQAHRVVLLDGGRVVADGTHAQLLATAPRYAAILAGGDPAQPQAGRR